MSETDLVRQRIGHCFGLAAQPSWELDLPCAVGELARRYGCRPNELLRRFGADPRALAEIAGRLTVGETYFLRHWSHFEFLVDLFRRGLREPGAKFTVWSAGCASGEEPYSVAIVAQEELGEEARKRLRIIASDLSRAAIEKARAGVYGAWSFRGTPPWFLARFFDSTDRQACRLSEAIRDAVQFRHLAVQHHAEELPERSLDVILFRNVALYLEKAARQPIYERFQRLLKPTGVLLMAPADPPPPAELFTRLDHESASIFAVHGAAALQDRASARRTAERATAAAGGKAGPEPEPPKPSAGVAWPVGGAATAGGILTRDVQWGLREAWACGDRGDVDRALAIAGDLIRSDPTSHAAYLLRGQIELAAMRNEEAVADLRRVVFLEPGHRLGRFWFAAALISVGALAAAARQLAELSRRLRSASREAALEDGETTVRELADAVGFMKESLQ